MEKRNIPIENPNLPLVPADFPLENPDFRLENSDSPSSQRPRPFHPQLFPSGFWPPASGLLFEQRFVQSRLSDDRGQGSRFEVLVDWNRHGACCLSCSDLHDPMAAALANFPKTLGFKQATHFDPRKALTRGHTLFQIG
jgi:hypothetical protein